MTPQPPTNVPNSTRIRKNLEGYVNFYHLAEGIIELLLEMKPISGLLDANKLEKQFNRVINPEKLGYVPNIRVEHYVPPMGGVSFTMYIEIKRHQVHLGSDAIDKVSESLYIPFNNFVELHTALQEELQSCKEMAQHYAEQVPLIEEAHDAWRSIVAAKTDYEEKYCEVITRVWPS
jgi:hypothetical protein